MKVGSDVAAAVAQIQVRNNQRGCWIQYEVLGIVRAELEAQIRDYMLVDSWQVDVAWVDVSQGWVCIDC